MLSTEQRNFINTNSEWFVAKITKVCPIDPADPCSNYTCSWTQLYFCDNMQKLTDIEQQLIYGDCEEGYNVAVPIDGIPEENTIVLMRQRGATDTFKNIYEFINGGGSGSELAMTALQCSGGILSATYSTGCVSADN